MYAPCTLNILRFIETPVDFHHIDTFTKLFDISVNRYSVTAIYENENKLQKI